MKIEKVNLLMSVDNPQGWTLESVLEKLAAELEAKNAKLISSTCEASAKIRMNNVMIIKHLLDAKDLQEESIVALMKVDSKDIAGNRKPTPELAETYEEPPYK